MRVMDSRLQKLNEIHIKAMITNDSRYGTVQQDNLKLENQVNNHPRASSYSSDSGMEEGSERSTSPCISEMDEPLNITDGQEESIPDQGLRKTLPLKPTVLTPSEGSAFNKIGKWHPMAPYPGQLPGQLTSLPAPLCSPAGLGYFPGYLVSPWLSETYHRNMAWNNYGQVGYSSGSTGSSPQKSPDVPQEISPDSARKRLPDVQERAEDLTEKSNYSKVDPRIPFTNYFLNLTKMLQRDGERVHGMPSASSYEQARGTSPQSSRHSECEQDFEPMTKSEKDTPKERVIEIGERQSGLFQAHPNQLYPAGFPGMDRGIAAMTGPTSMGQHPLSTFPFFGGMPPSSAMLHPALLQMSASMSGKRPLADKPTPIKKYKCDVCGKAFSRSNTLVTHKRIHTGDKPFKCEVCGRAFRQPGNLTRHRLTHTTVKPYVCPQCNKAFNRASNLHTHMRTHTNFKPFVCPYCGKGFHQKIDMKIHCYTHTGERPHRCDVCGKGFTLASTLSTHRRIHFDAENFTMVSHDPTRK